MVETGNNTDVVTGLEIVTNINIVLWI